LTPSLEEASMASSACACPTVRGKPSRMKPLAHSASKKTHANTIRGFQYGKGSSCAML
jgi:hypothetical protein